MSGKSSASSKSREARSGPVRRAHDCTRYCRISLASVARQDWDTVCQQPEVEGANIQILGMNPESSTPKAMQADNASLSAAVICKPCGYDCSASCQNRNVILGHSRILSGGEVDDLSLKHRDP